MEKDLQWTSKNIIDISKDFYIKFPSGIKFISSSFVVGLFFEIVNEIGLKMTEERAHIISEYESVRSIINKIMWKELLFCLLSQNLIKIKNFVGSYIKLIMVDICLT